MGMFAPPAATYQHTISGTWGEFATPAGRVSYVLTKARLGKTGTDHERRLTSQLRPVREVLDSSTLNFNQLLQRDLDDHRVATELLPYLLTPKPTGPAFFPPIVGVLLPFRGPDPVNRFPAPTPEVEVDADGAKYLETQFGDAFRVRLLSWEGKPHPTIKLANLGWNEEHTKLVVLDGQHRAMALIAVDRTLNLTWASSGAERYRHFYEHRVNVLLEQHAKAGHSIDLDRIEVPVVIAWFPDLGDGSAHKAARKLFVDVNKEARTPSEARLTLLSDTELLNIFSRRLLNRLREEHPPMPLYAIEYDNPNKESARPVRWSVLTNLALLKYGVQYTVFGPDRYVRDLTTRFGGRPNWTQMNERMRRELQLDAVLPKVIKDDDREFDRNRVSNDDFPLSAVDKISDAFMASWGSAILTLLGGIRPYAAHCAALRDLKDGWITDDAMSSLAADALFVGVGMFWTLRNSDAHWKELVQRRSEERRPIPPKPEIVKAWEILERGEGSKAQEFELRRAFHYVGRTDAKTLRDTGTFFDIANTHACQLGLLLAFASLACMGSVQGSDLPGFASRLVHAWNAALSEPVTKTRGREFALARADVSTNKYPLNRIPKMDTPMAVHFRYFWLELLNLPTAFEHVSSLVDRDNFLAHLWAARRSYVQYLVQENVKASRFRHPRASDASLRDKAEATELEAVRRALDWAFAMDKDEWAMWLETWRSGNARQQQTGMDEVADAEADAEPTAATDDESVDSFLATPDDEE